MQHTTAFRMMCLISSSDRNGHLALPVDVTMRLDGDMEKEAVSWDLGFIRHQLDHLAELRVEGDWGRTDERDYQELCRAERCLL